MNILFRILFVVWLTSIPEAWATCYKVTGVGTATTTALDQIRPGEGSAGAWDGACDSCNGSLGLPNVVSVAGPEFQPYPTLLASSVADAARYGKMGGYSLERVFFRCAPNDPVYEMFSTNADDAFSGYYNGGDTLGNSLGLQSAYRTAWSNVLLRLTHVETGKYFTDVWNERLLTGLDVDSRGFKLVKTKNLSAVRSELFSAPNEATYYYPSTLPTQLYGYYQPAAYIAIKGPGLAYPRVGQTHAGNYDGWHYNWPLAIGLYNTVTLKRLPTCAVINVTPNVVFPRITVDQLNAGLTREVPFSVNFKCQAGFSASASHNGPAIGVKVSSGAAIAAARLGLSNASNGLSYLVSDRYAEPGMAQGVGIRILRNGVPINLLVNEDSALGVNPGLKGWYAVLSGAAVGTREGDVTKYSETFQARLEKLSIGTRPEVSAGLVEATAQIVIRVQ